MDEKDSLGLNRGSVAFHPYTPEWARLFEEERGLLRTALGSLALDIQHVGSAAIPGMVVKPILDMAIAIRDFEDGPACVAPLSRLGYEYRG